jgi:hypothetical protein
MTIMLQLSAEQERQLEEGATRHDRTAAQPDSETRRALLEELAAEFADLSPLSADAVSRAGIYGDHPGTTNSRAALRQSPPP